MRFPILGAAALLALGLGLPAAAAADQANRDDVYAASKSADIEAMRLRMAAHPSASATSTFLEAQEALRRYREAAPEHKTQARAVLDASLARLEIEVNQR